MKLKDRWIFLKVHEIEYILGVINKIRDKRIVVSEEINSIKRWIKDNQAITLSDFETYKKIWTRQFEEGDYVWILNFGGERMIPGVVTKVDGFTIYVDRIDNDRTFQIYRNEIALGLSWEEN